MEIEKCLEIIEIVRGATSTTKEKELIESVLDLEDFMYSELEGEKLEKLKEIHYNLERLLNLVLKTNKKEFLIYGIKLFDILEEDTIGKLY